MISYLRTREIAIGGAFALTLSLAWCAYHPGLIGNFVFDDFANLPALGNYGRIDNWKAFWLYLTSGGADPTGRPLALLSFLIDANDWPAEPYSFKRTGVLLHLLNGALLAWLLLRLGRAARQSEVLAAMSAILASALWLLHPLFLSTTLYVVQRETVLAATFMLLGILGYVCGRDLAMRGRTSGALLAALSIGTCTLLGVLCKANAALLPLLALVTDYLLLLPNARLQCGRAARTFTTDHVLFLVVPSLLLGLYLVFVAYQGSVHGIPPHRPWTIGERLLTEPRMLIRYLGLLWLPRAFSTGLFNDEIAASHGLLSPPNTLICIVAVVALLAFAWRVRRTHAVLALSLLFYFAGHLLESTVIPLELYFEHRNYLPAALMFWPLSLWICGNLQAGESSPQQQQRWGVPSAILAAALPLSLAGLTWLGAGLWGNVRAQGLIWAARNPDSPRAQANAAQIELARGETVAAIARLEHSLRDHPSEVQLALNLVGAKCLDRALTKTDIAAAAAALRTARDSGRLGYEWFDLGIPAAARGTCPELTLDTIDELLAAAAQNTQMQRIPGRVQDVRHLQARVALLRGDGERALALFDAALDADPRPAAGLNQAAILGSAGRQDLALRHLDHLERVWHPPASPGWTMQSLHLWLLAKNGYWHGEIAHLRAALAHDEPGATAPDAQEGPS
jgi:tetratricopeptide (TPR) repeat protein